jgi:hypothetical protein
MKVERKKVLYYLNILKEIDNMAFKMKPSGSKKCSYSGMKKKGLLNDSPSTSNGNTMAYQKLDPKAAQKEAEETAEHKNSGKRFSGEYDLPDDKWRMDQMGEVNDASQAAAQKFNKLHPEVWNAFQNTKIKEGTKPDIRGNYGVFDPETQQPSSHKMTTKKASEAAKQAYRDAFIKFKSTDDDYQRQRELIKRGVVGDAVTEDPDLLS